MQFNYCRSDVVKYRGLAKFHIELVIGKEQAIVDVSQHVPAADSEHY